MSAGSLLHSCLASWSHARAVRLLLRLGLAAPLITACLTVYPCMHTLPHPFHHFVFDVDLSHQYCFANLVIQNLSLSSCNGQSVAAYDSNHGVSRVSCAHSQLSRLCLNFSPRLTSLNSSESSRPQTTMRRSRRHYSHSL